MRAIFLRSLAFNVLFYMLLVLLLFAALPTFLMPRWGIVNVAKFWGRSSIWRIRIRISYGRTVRRGRSSSLLVVEFYCFFQVMVRV